MRGVMQLAASVRELLPPATPTPPTRVRPLFFPTDIGSEFLGVSRTKLHYFVCLLSGWPCFRLRAAYSFVER